jgi:predicted unusual protein kinase regulating ubiquinone biosynthesis (AarF/ABC1/UbiB family)
MKGKNVPKHRLSRMAHMGGLAGRIAGNILLDGGRQWLAGQKPQISDLILTRKNIEQVAERLSTLRGAAMKLGQLISMDTGSVLPEELSLILNKLRSEAQTMPTTQLIKVLERSWGEEWMDRFSTFSYKPVAAASIGQVHRAVAKDGREMALKVQYPGVRKSIDSDLANVATLLRMTGLVPKDLDLNPLLDEAKLQLQKEADYLKEGEALEWFNWKLSEFERASEVRVPDYYLDHSNQDVLAMSFEEGEPLERLVNHPDCDRVVSLMFELFFFELMKIHAVQTDPNLANYHYQPHTGQLILLDFGALREYTPEFANQYFSAIQAAVDQDETTLEQALKTLGFFHKGLDVANRAVILSLFQLAVEPLRTDGNYDFGASDLAERIREKGMQISRQPEAWHTPPVDVLFLHRKLAGLYLMARKLKAQVDVRSIYLTYLER